MRLNIGCGAYPLRGWVNLDNDPASAADRLITVPPIPYDDGSVDEIYAGHFLEHLSREDADTFMFECYRCIVPGGILGIVVPDLAEVMRRYLDPEEHALVEYPLGTWNDLHDINHLNAIILYSTVQESPHKWMYDHRSLTTLMQEHGFEIVKRINPWMDPRIPVGAWYQFGIDAIKV